LNAAILLQPVIPESATKILDYLQVPATSRSLAYATLLDDNADHQVLGGSVDNGKSFVAFRKLSK
jgi:methionyl-tRNA synthetase